MPSRSSYRRDRSSPPAPSTSISSDQASVCSKAPLSPFRKKISIRSRHPRSALTFYSVKKVLDEFTLVEVKPVTGRTHQIRVHFAAAGHPIVGDTRYGSKDKAKRHPRLYLHAWHIVFSHPVTKRLLEFYAPLPPEFQKIIHTPSVS